MKKERKRREDATVYMLRKEAGIPTRILFYAVLIGFTVLTLYPLVWLVINSFKTTAEFYMNPLGFPRRFYLDNYPLAWRLGNFGILAVNSVIYTVVSTVAIIFLAQAAGFAFAKIKCRATPILYGAFILGLLLTVQSLIVPLFLMSFSTGLYNTRLGVIIPYVALGLPIPIYLCTEYIKGIPDSLVESARMDGAGYLRILINVIMPMTKPVAATAAILTVLAVWNEFVLVFILTGHDSLRSLPVGIFRFSGELASDYGKQFAALVVGMIPIVLFYLVFRNQITRGVAAGAIKG